MNLDTITHTHSACNRFSKNKQIIIFDCPKQCAIRDMCVWVCIETAKQMAVFIKANLKNENASFTPFWSIENQQKGKKKTIYLVCIVRDNVVHFSFEQWQRRLMTLDDKQWRDQSSISNNSDGKQMTRRTKAFCSNDILTESLSDAEKFKGFG